MKILRLPDLPDAGYSTPKQKELSDSIMLLIRGLERDRLTLLNIVIVGLNAWRRSARSIWPKADDEALDEVFHYLELAACLPKYQRQLLAVAHNPPKWRDVMREAMPNIEEQREALRVMEKWNPYQRARSGRIG